jgi:membrane-bound lytic murein transglycosylase A
MDARMAAVAVAGLIAASGARADPALPLTPLPFSALAGWADDDHAAAFAAFRTSCSAIDVAAPALRPGRAIGPALARACASAAALEAPDSATARAFFERTFEPVRVGRGRLTGYYEPEIAGSLEPLGDLDTPLLGRPTDLVTLAEGERVAGVPEGFAAARRTGDGHEAYPTRAEIEAGALAGRGLELVYLARVDAFFVHVQGSSRVRLPDGRALRLAYAGRNGRPFTAIGRRLVERGEMTREEAGMAAIRAWLAARPAAGRALMRENDSYIFFRIDDALRPQDGPRGAQGVPLAAGRSLAVDRTLWPYGLPFWIDGRLPDGTAVRRLMTAQDTGSAILGAARGDYFAGTGDAAGALAGAMRDEAEFVVLLPREGGPGE